MYFLLEKVNFYCHVSLLEGMFFLPALKSKSHEVMHLCKFSQEMDAEEAVFLREGGPKIQSGGWLLVEKVGSGTSFFSAFSVMLGSELLHERFDFMFLLQENGWTYPEQPWDEQYIDLHIP